MITRHVRHCAPTNIITTRSRNVPVSSSYPSSQHYHYVGGGVFLIVSQSIQTRLLGVPRCLCVVHSANISVPNFIHRGLCWPEWDTPSRHYIISMAVLMNYYYDYTGQTNDRLSCLPSVPSNRLNQFQIYHVECDHMASWRLSLPVSHCLPPDVLHIQLILLWWW